ncbi:hypothetical protein BFU36_02110 [Sulfolobus sp. A20]|uniref:hypothetical protein n=1 Tax=Saccharolobus sp. A20 TaxID=1891280 RepID=UPI000845DBF7|nr:hypothetical protein [Sulfolobus sp. A20]TRM78280.1 hypothetical protein DJ532_01690 [Sulfolobus sp. A20-N-F8]TRM80060.1 hypothetical protein DJ524_08790 [Sulfolobus sp. D5]TRM81811.1 hypothetical protein DJ531_10405 [Sulfolobus sp. A20-N-F6]TRM84727.1 hypothetical protein DJ522_03625 [Sulfolobus sp. F3]TRM86661.1 hypothetical protein DJ529_10740 [Sulfolobus sp. C3]TRM94435.1 hypothetical protein DJ526_02550 [Sulfolobus sp. A20-N-G8]TRM98362.1 hypothetical protein DJ530_11055 [Sulfolobus 
MDKPDFEETLYIVSGIIFLAALGIALEFIGQYLLGDLMVIISVLWALFILILMKYIEKKDDEKYD